MEQAKTRSVRVLLASLGPPTPTGTHTWDNREWDSAESANPNPR
jgi:hypothetical protein